MTDDLYGPGFVYLLEGNEGWYRIGRTANPKQRWTFYRWWSKNNGYGLKPVFLVRVARQRHAERMLHNIFNDKRTNKRHRGLGPRHEWFKLDARDLLIFKKWATTIGQETIDLKGEWIDGQALV